MLQTIAFPQSLENVGTHVVTNTRWEKSRLESSNEIIVNNILLAVKENLTEYTVPENVVSIGSGVFMITQYWKNHAEQPGRSNR